MEEYKTEIETVLKFLKSKGHTRRVIERRLGYAMHSIDQMIAKGGNKKMLKILNLYKDWVLQKTILLEAKQELLDAIQKIDSKITEMSGGE